MRARHLSRMRLVIDANILFAALIRDGKTAGLLFHKHLDLHAPRHLQEELINNLAEIHRKTKRTDIDEAVRRALARITIHDLTELRDTWNRAADATPDPKDTAYFALALALRCPFWTAERGLERQTAVRVVRTEGLLRRFKKA